MGGVIFHMVVCIDYLVCISLDFSGVGNIIVVIGEGIFYAQISDSDNPRIVLCIPRIRAGNSRITLMSINPHQAINHQHTIAAKVELMFILYI